jgi:hypothetical protein
MTARDRRFGCGRTQGHRSPARRRTAERSQRRELVAAGYPVGWDTGLTIFRGENWNGSTLLSRSDGRHAARLLFQLPKKQSILTIDARTLGRK